MAGKKHRGQLNRTVIEVGPQKVPIPVLDFSRLPRRKPARVVIAQPQDEASASASGSAQQELNQGVMMSADSSNGVNEESPQPDGILDNFLHNIGEVSRTISSTSKTQ